MDIDIGQLTAILANVGVIAGIVFLAWELRQNNRLLRAQARFSLRQYRAEVASTLMVRETLESAHRYASGDGATAVDRSAALMCGVKSIELWEWQYGEYEAGLLRLDQLPIEAWRVWFNGKGEVPVPVAEVWEQRKHAINPAFVEFFENNVINH